MLVRQSRFIGPRAEAYTRWAQDFGERIAVVFHGVGRYRFRRRDERLGFDVVFLGVAVTSLRLLESTMGMVTCPIPSTMLPRSHELL